MNFLQLVENATPVIATL